MPAIPAILNFFLAAAPSDISPAVPSPSLPDPAPILDLRAAAAAACGRGVPPRLPVAGVAVFFIFFREDSLPLDSDNAGEPGRFKLLGFFKFSPLGFP